MKTNLRLLLILLSTPALTLGMEEASKNKPKLESRPSVITSEAQPEVDPYTLEFIVQRELDILTARANKAKVEQENSGNNPKAISHEKSILDYLKAKNLCNAIWALWGQRKFRTEPIYSFMQALLTQGKQETINLGAQLFKLIKNGDNKKIKDLILDGIDLSLRLPNEFPNELRNTPLHYACITGNLDAVQILLDHGANPNKKNRYGETPLFYCASGRGIKLSIANLLLQHGAKINSLDSYGRNIIHTMVKSFLTNINGLSGSLEFFLQHGADPDLKDDYGDTPLHYAIALGRASYEKTKCFVEHGAAIDVQNNYGDTPLHTAAINCSSQIVSFLVEEKGANVLIKNKEGETAADLIEKDIDNHPELKATSLWILNYLRCHEEHAYAKLRIQDFMKQEIPQDTVEAAKYFKIAADLGQPDAQNELGRLYFNGKGVSQDYDNAEKYFTLAANQGNLLAQSDLGLLYKVKKEYHKAKKFYELALNGGLGFAQYNLESLNKLIEKESSDLSQSKQ